MSNDERPGILATIGSAVLATVASLGVGGSVSAQSDEKMPVMMASGDGPPDNLEAAVDKGPTKAPIFADDPSQRDEWRARVTDRNQDGTGIGRS